MNLVVAGPAETQLDAAAPALRDLQPNLGEDQMETEKGEILNNNSKYLYSNYKQLKS